MKKENSFFITFSYLLSSLAWIPNICMLYHLTCYSHSEKKFTLSLFSTIGNFYSFIFKYPYSLLAVKSIQWIYFRYSISVFKISIWLFLLHLFLCWDWRFLHILSYFMRIVKKNGWFFCFLMSLLAPKSRDNCYFLLRSDLFSGLNFELYTNSKILLFFF